MKLSISSATIGAIIISASPSAAFAPLASNVVRSTVHDASKSPFSTSQLFMSDNDVSDVVEILIDCVHDSFELTIWQYL